MQCGPVIMSTPAYYIQSVGLAYLVITKPVRVSGGLDLSLREIIGLQIPSTITSPASELITHSVLHDRIHPTLFPILRRCDARCTPCATCRDHPTARRLSRTWCKRFSCAPMVYSPWRSRAKRTGVGSGTHVLMRKLVLQTNMCLAGPDRRVGNPKSCRWPLVVRVSRVPCRAKLGCVRGVSKLAGAGRRGMADACTTPRHQRGCLRGGMADAAARLLAHLSCLLAGRCAKGRGRAWRGRRGWKVAWGRW